MMVMWYDDDGVMMTIMLMVVMIRRPLWGHPRLWESLLSFSEEAVGLSLCVRYWPSLSVINPLSSVIHARRLPTKSDGIKYKYTRVKSSPCEQKCLSTISCNSWKWRRTCCSIWNSEFLSASLQTDPSPKNIDTSTNTCPCQEDCFCTRTCETTTSVDTLGFNHYYASWLCGYNAAASHALEHSERTLTSPESGWMLFSSKLK